MQKTVSFRYTDGRASPPPGYVVTVGPAQVHMMLSGGAPIEIVEGAEVLADWRAAHDVTDAAPAPESAPGATTTAPAGAKDGWPDGATYTRRGAYYDVTVGGETRTGIRGKAAAIEAAWGMA